MYDNIILSLKEQGIIKTKWISEFSLYLLVKSYYKDTIYQHRSDWLGLQSLDIFIPSLSLAIEYQGEQHSRPIDIFGGEEHYRATVERDKHKKLLCEENNVKLIYWNYDEDINDNVFESKLREMGISFSRRKEFPEVHTSVSKKTTKVNSTKQKTFVYQYDTTFKLVRTYDTISDAAKAAEVGQTSISKSINGERLLSGGYFWYRGEVPLQEIPSSWIARIKSEHECETNKKQED
jgi:hypothetical protein